MASEDSVQTHILIETSGPDEPSRGFFGRYFPPATRTELWAGVFFLVVSVAGAVWVIKWRYDELALERDGVVVEARVLRLWTTPAKGGKRYRVEYEFAVSTAEGPIRDTADLLKECFDQLKEGGPLEVRMCRTDPANHRAINERPQAQASIEVVSLCLSVLGVLAVAGLINLWWWLVSRRQGGSSAFIVWHVRQAQR